MICRKRWRRHSFKETNDSFLLFQLWGQAAWTILTYTKLHDRKFSRNDLSPKTVRRRGNMSLKFGHQKIFSSIQIEMDLFLLQNNSETWGCPWNWERWFLTQLYKIFFTLFVIQTGIRPVVKGRNGTEKVSICNPNVFQKWIPQRTNILRHTDLFLNIMFLKDSYQIYCIIY